jgi:arylsulfatase A-like enzyme
LIIFAPGLVRKKTVVDEQMRSRDLLPTLFELAGYPLPERVRRHIDGISLVPLLNGAKLDLTVFSDNGRQTKAIRKNSGWKLIWHLDTNERELYNTRSDPGERVDLADRHPDILAALQEELMLHIYGGQ